MLGNGASAAAKAHPENGNDCNSLGLRLLPHDRVLAFWPQDPSAARTFARPIPGLSPLVADLAYSAKIYAARERREKHYREDGADTTVTGAK
jgi:hypothetical protein